MPIVHAYYKPAAVRTAVRIHSPRGIRKMKDPVGTVSQILQLIISSALNAPPNGELMPGHILVFFHEIGPHDTAQEDLYLEISAMDYPERVGNRNERRERLMDALHGLFPGLDVSVYLVLSQASWGSDIPDEPLDTDFDMSMEAALGHCRDLLEAAN